MGYQPMAKLIAGNKKAHFDYFIEDTYEAGIELDGWEVKSARAGNVNLKDSFVRVRDGECWLKNAHFSPYPYGDVQTQDTRRDRRLLLHKAQISKIATAVAAKGFTCVATKLYFNSKNRIKIEVALAKGKHNYDKKKVQKEKDIARETARAIAAR